MDPNNNPNNIQQDSGSSTVSHLPILFANGYPTSLERMSEEKLEEFIPFLLKCSGSITEKNLKPTWWPDSMNFTIPFCRPEKFEGVRERENLNIFRNSYLNFKISPGLEGDNERHCAEMLLSLQKRIFINIFQGTK